MGKKELVAGIVFLGHHKQEGGNRFDFTALRTKRGASQIAQISYRNSEPLLVDTVIPTGWAYRLAYVFTEIIFSSFEEIALSGSGNSRKQVQRAIDAEKRLSNG